MNWITCIHWTWERGPPCHDVLTVPRWNASTSRNITTWKAFVWISTIHHNIIMCNTLFASRLNILLPIQEIRASVRTEVWRSTRSGIRWRSFDHLVRFLGANVLLSRLETALVHEQYCGRVLCDDLHCASCRRLILFRYACMTTGQVELFQNILQTFINK